MSLLLTGAGPSSETSGPPVTSGLLANWDFGLADNMRPNTDGSGSAVINGQQIKWVRDLSPNANHMTPATANGPTWGAGLFNGRGAARFTGAQALGSLANLGNGVSDVSIFVVGARTGATVGLGNVFVSGVVSFGTPGGAWFGTSDVGSFWKLEASGAVIDYTSTMPYDSRLRIFDWTRTNAAAGERFVRGDGVALFNGAGNYAIANGPAFIGGWSTNFVAADICAVLAYNRVLSPTECAQVELYLANLYGINIPGATWQGAYSPIQQASIYAATLNANMLGTSADPLKYHFDGENVDELGTNNASLTEGSTQATWANLGVLASSDATQGTDSLRPTLQKNIVNGLDALTFGGNGDLLTIANSAVDLSFLHNTNDFDVFVVGRKDLASRQVMLASTDTAAESGFVLDFDATGKAHIKITKGGGLTVADVTYGTATPVGDTFKLEMYGTAGATALRLTDIGTAASNLSAVGAGNATNAATIGGLASTSVGSFDGPLHLILIYSKKLPTPQAQALHEYLASRFSIV